MASTAGVGRFPLEMNCEDAVAYLAEYIERHPVLRQREVPDFSAATNNFAFLETLSRLLLVPELTECIAIAFYPVLPDLVGRLAEVEMDRTEEVACALGRLVYLDPRLKR